MPLIQRSKDALRGKEAPHGICRLKREGSETEMNVWRSLRHSSGAKIPRFCHLVRGLDKFFLVEPRSCSRVGGLALVEALGPSF